MSSFSLQLNILMYSTNCVMSSNLKSEQPSWSGGEYEQNLFPASLSPTPPPIMF